MKCCIFPPGVGKPNFVFLRFTRYVFSVLIRACALETTIAFSCPKVLWAECCAFIFFSVLRLMFKHFLLLGRSPRGICHKVISASEDREMRNASGVNALLAARFKWFSQARVWYRPLHTKLAHKTLRLFPQQARGCRTPCSNLSWSAPERLLLHSIRSEWAHFLCASPHVSYLLYGIRAASLSCVVSSTTKRYSFLHEPRRGLERNVE